MGICFDCHKKKGETMDSIYTYDENLSCNWQSTVQQGKKAYAQIVTYNYKYNTL